MRKSSYLYHKRRKMSQILPTLPNFNEIENQILSYWGKIRLSRRLLQRNASAGGKKVFYDGPMATYGEPHHGILTTFAIKDVIIRYWIMCGYDTDFMVGWDCHGLPVQHLVEDSIMRYSRGEIRKYGLARYISNCEELTLSHIQKLKNLEDRIGRLIEKDNQFYTMSPQYMSSLWWGLSQIDKQGLLYESSQVLPYSIGLQRFLTETEVMQGEQREVDIKSLIIKVPLKNRRKTFILIQLDEPWKLLSTIGISIDQNKRYVLVQEHDSKFYVLKSEVHELFKDKLFSVISEIDGTNLLGIECLFPIKGILQCNYVKVTNEPIKEPYNTGVLFHTPHSNHSNRFIQDARIKVRDIIDNSGNLVLKGTLFDGMFYNEASEIVMKMLRARDLIFSHKEGKKKILYCWRTNTEIIYKSTLVWFIAISKIRNKLISNSKLINWGKKNSIKNQFENRLMNARDWQISRKRYWGTPIPIWKSIDNTNIVVASSEELEELSGILVNNLHRPNVDISFECKGKTFSRILDVFDVWFETGAVPFAKNGSTSTKNIETADFVTESKGQMYGWFYYMHILGTLISQKPCFKKVITSGFVLDDNRQKIRRSSQNYVSPDTMIRLFGADALRLCGYNSTIPDGKDATISEITLKLQQKKFILPLWNIYRFFHMKVIQHEWNLPIDLTSTRKTILDEWLQVRSHQTIFKVRSLLDAYQIHPAILQIQELILDIKQWYLPNIKNRIEKDQTVLYILFVTIFDLVKLLSPFTPFICEYIYQELKSFTQDSEVNSVFLEEYPNADSDIEEKNKGLLESMRIVRQIVLAIQRKLREAIYEIYRVDVFIKKGKTESVPDDDWFTELINSIIKVPCNVHVVEKHIPAISNNAQKQGDSLRIFVDLK